MKVLNDDKEPATLSLGEIALRLTEVCIKEGSPIAGIAIDNPKIGDIAPNLFKQILVNLSAEAEGVQPGAEPGTVGTLATIKCAGMGCGFERPITLDWPKLPILPIRITAVQVELDHVRCPKCDVPGSMNVEFVK